MSSSGDLLGRLLCPQVIWVASFFSELCPLLALKVWIIKALSDMQTWPLAVCWAMWADAET